MDTILSVDEAAAFTHRSPDTIRRWIERNKLPARKLEAGGHGIYAILRSDLLEVMISGALTGRTARSKAAVSIKQPLLPL